ncbi:hypothetical protein C1645_814264 [Glomus cerebriforme]|uniref:Uncharacterized protein n=1 Tax=Glomus cerebriforme TaxID=658196 RepID=A0A397TGJ9_9GLOM|nr:hypothetical protein C1645_814264 [Glomus cerebriforme]
MNNNNLEQLLNINKFLSIIPSPDIHSVQAYVLSINTSDIFSIAFNTPHETFPLLANIDNTAKKILHLQYPHLTSATVFSNRDSLNLAKNSDMLTTYHNKEREYIDHFVSVFKRNSLFSLDPNVDIKMHDDQSSEDENIPFNIIELEKYSNIVKFNLNIDDNDGELSSSSLSSSSFSSSLSSLHVTNNKKDIKK